MKRKLINTIVIAIDIAVVTVIILNLLSPTIFAIVPQMGAVGVIGGADGPTAYFVSTTGVWLVVFYLFIGFNLLLLPFNALIFLKKQFFNENHKQRKTSFFHKNGM